jgi:hypothetical protein
MRILNCFESIEKMRGCWVYGEQKNRRGDQVIQFLNAISICGIRNF